MEARRKDSISVRGAPGQAASKQKMRELILYIANKSKGDQHFGAIKLNKILFFSDFGHYRSTGQSITGYKYARFDQGPVPRSGHKVVEELVAEGALKVTHVDIYGWDQHRPEPLREAEASTLSAEELQLVDRVIAKYWPYTAKRISDESHDFDGWRLAENNEDIPYAVSRIDAKPELTPEMIAIAERIASETRAA